MRSRQAALPFILVTVLIDMLGIGLVIPVLPKLVTQLYGGDLSAGSTIFGWFVAAYALMQFIFAPILGNLSDAYGRRPIILSSLTGAGLDYLLMAFAPNLQWLFVGRIISGITGANFTAANAYIADVTPPEERAKSYGLLGACFGVGFIIGPVIGGLLGNNSLRAPFIAAAILNLCNALYGFFVLPESHPRENRRAFVFSKSNPLASLKGLSRYPVVFGLTATLFLERLAHDTLPSTWVLYTTYRFNWTPRDNGLSLALVGIMFAVVSGGLTGIVVKKLGERRALITGLIVGSFTFVIYGMATAGWMLYAGIIFGSIGGVAAPALQSLISKGVPTNEQGAVQGAVSSIQSIAAVLGPIIATSLFGYFTSTTAPIKLPGAAFLAASLMVLTGAILAFRAIYLRAENQAALQPSLQEK
ncbi:MAG TPA: TCR/Tet family MFS transporter [Blastocatellia bacterium]|nr:TCR/Tet family MFS transporter [Blastocatellia bacterium]